MNGSMTLEQIKFQMSWGVMHRLVNSFNWVRDFCLYLKCLKLVFLSAQGFRDLFAIPLEEFNKNDGSVVKVYKSVTLKTRAN